MRRFHPSMEWYIDTMITLIERGGEFVTRDVWHSTVQLVSGCQVTCLGCNGNVHRVSASPLCTCWPVANSMLHLACAHLGGA